MTASHIDSRSIDNQLDLSEESPFSPANSLRRDLIRERRISEDMSRFTIEIMAHKVLSPGGTINLKSLTPQFIDHSALRNVGLSPEDVEKIRNQIIKRIGLSYNADGVILMDRHNNSKWTQYLKSDALHNRPYALEFTVDPSIKFNHDLTDDELLRAIPEHVGHGVSAHAYSKEGLKESMREERRSDCRSAQKLWNAWTTLYKEPSLSSLRTAVIVFMNSGEWRDKVTGIDSVKRGSFQSFTCSWVTLLHRAGIIADTKDLRILADGSPSNAEAWDTLNRTLSTLVRGFIKESYILTEKVRD